MRDHHPFMAVYQTRDTVVGYLAQHQLFDQVSTITSLGVKMLFVVLSVQ